MPLFHHVQVFCHQCGKPERKMFLGVNAIGEMRLQAICADCEVVSEVNVSYDDLVRDCQRAEITDAENVDLAEVIVRGLVL